MWGFLLGSLALFEAYGEVFVPTWGWPILDDWPPFQLLMELLGRRHRRRHRGADGRSASATTRAAPTASRRFAGSNFKQAYFVEAVVLIEGIGILGVRARSPRQRARDQPTWAAFVTEPARPAAAGQPGPGLGVRVRQADERHGLADRRRPHADHGRRLAPVPRVLQHLLQARGRRRRRAGRAQADDVRRQGRSTSRRPTRRGHLRRRQDRGLLLEGLAGLLAPAPSAAAASRSARRGTPASRCRRSWSSLRCATTPTRRRRTCWPAAAATWPATRSARPRRQHAALAHSRRRWRSPEAEPAADRRRRGERRHRPGGAVGLHHLRRLRRAVPGGHRARRPHRRHAPLPGDDRVGVPRPSWAGCSRTWRTRATRGARTPRTGWPGPRTWTSRSRCSTATLDDDAEYLFWVGCAGAFEDRAKKTTRAVAELLHMADVKFTVLGTGGDLHRRPGAPGRQRVPVPDAGAAERRGAQLGVRGPRAQDARSSSPARTASTPWPTSTRSWAASTRSCTTRSC